MLHGTTPTAVPRSQSSACLRRRRGRGTGRDLEVRLTSVSLAPESCARVLAPMNDAITSKNLSMQFFLPQEIQGKKRDHRTFDCSVRHALATDYTLYLLLRGHYGRGTDRSIARSIAWPGPL